MAGFSNKGETGKIALFVERWREGAGFCDCFFVFRLPEIFAKWFLGWADVCCIRCSLDSLAKMVSGCLVV